MQLPHSSIKFKVTGLVLLSALLPFLVFYIFGLRNFLSDMENALARELSTKASLTAKDIDRFIEQRIVDTKTIAHAQAFSNSGTEEAIRYLHAVAIENPWINEIDLLDKNGVLIAHSADMVADESINSEVYASLKPLWENKVQLQAGAVYVTETETLDNGEGAGLLFLTPIEKASRFLLVELAFKDIQSIAVDFSNALESNSYVYLVKNDGRVMVSDDPSVQPYQAFPDIKQHPDMLRFFSESGAEGHFRYIDRFGNATTAAYADLSEFGVNHGLDWSIITIASENVFFSSINSSKNRLIILGLLVTFFMASIAFALSAKITRPLLKTVNAAKKLAEGDHSSPITAEGSTETRLLANSFNRMAEQIVQRNRDLEEEIIERKYIEKDLLESNSMKNEFIATASHELRTPLSTVIGYSELLIENDNFSPEEKREFLQYIYDKAFSLDRIVDELLDVSRIETGRTLSISPTMVKIAEIAKQVTRQFQKECQTCNFDISFGNEEMKCLADEGKLFQVFENLIGNAVKFSPDGGKISITGEQLKGHYKVSISDRGRGINPDQRELIFDKFYRTDTSDTAVQGLGIGLYLAKNIIHLHKGQIGVDSLPGKGSTFFFTLPMSN